MIKKILIIINNLGVGGAERVVVHDVNEMLKMGLDVKLITLKNEKEFSLEGGLLLEKHKKILIPFASFFDFKSWRKLHKEIKDYKPDLVVTHLWFANTIGRLAAYFAGVSRVISFEQNVYDSIKTKKMFFVDWFLQIFSNKIIAVSEAVKKSLIRHFIKESKIEVIHNSIDIEPFQRSITPNIKVRKEFAIPTDAFLYIFIGRLIHQKAVDIILAAFKEVGSGFLLIVGQGNDREDLEREVEKKGLSGRVVFAGVRHDIPQLLSSADCFILPSRYEGSPLVLIEALAAGISIIVSDFEAAKEIIIHEKNGLIVPRENVQKLKDAMVRIKEDSVLRARLSAEAKKTANNFSISSHVRAILRYINI
ncbi:MAG: putative glycosyltransferase [Candidatus Parcubacteria bacterium]|jgi:glycosyltransferase involved in cell wall biosynthesis